MLKAPDDLGTAVAFLTAPDENFVPAPVRGMPAIGVLVCYSGDIDHGLQLLNPLLEFGSPAATLVQPMPYVAVQQLLDESNPTGKLNYWSADSFSDLPDEAVDRLVELATRPVSPFSQVILLPGGGALSPLAEEAKAFGSRRATWNMHYLSMWADPIDTERNVAYTRKLSATMKPWSTGPAYLNFLSDEGQDRIAVASSPEKYRRFQILKAKYDPSNLFSQNQNIPPASLTT
jgi:hypothetical protein